MVSCDASKYEDNQKLIRWLHESMPAVQFFIHAAGVLAFDTIADITRDTFNDVVAPKVCTAHFDNFIVLYTN